MKKNYTHISVVLDRSGSMGSCKKDTMGGFNQFLEAQRKVEGEATITMVQFDNEYEILVDMVPISGATELNDNNYQPRGGTALLDAIGRTINRVEHQINEKAEDQKPEKTIFVIITDGEENQSREFSRDQIMQMINRHREEMGWEFVFIGANQDAIQAGSDLGVRGTSAYTYTASAMGTQVMYNTLSRSMTSYRKAATTKDLAFFNAEDQEEQKDTTKKT